MTAEPRKQIYLVRHAESINNVDKREVRTAWSNLKRLRSFPSSQQWRSMRSILTVPMDTDLSLNGERMASRLGYILSESNFVVERGVQLIVHSNLLRAKRTCFEIFGLTSNTANNVQVPIEQHDGIFERDISEHFGVADLANRVREFRDWLMARPESVIVVVGHSAFFRKLLCTDCHMNNCEVLQVDLQLSDGSFQNPTVIVQGGASLLEPLEPL